MRKFSLAISAIKIFDKKRWWQIFSGRFVQGILASYIEAKNADEAQEAGLMMSKRIYPPKFGWTDHKCGVHEVI